MKRKAFAAPAMVGLIILAVWYVLLWSGTVGRYFAPSPHEIVQAAWEERSILFFAAGQTLTAAATGFVAASCLGFATALCLTASTTLRAALTPWVHTFQMMPVIALVPIYILWLGEGFPSVVAVAFTISFFPVTANATQGLLSVPREHLDLFRLLRAGRWATLFQLRVPFALPYLFTGLQIAATLAVIGAITGEFFAGTATGAHGGLGFLILTYKAHLEVPALFAAAVLACALGGLFVGAVRAARRRALAHWHESAQNSSS